MRERGQHHVLRLQVGGKAGMRQSLDVGGQDVARALDGDALALAHHVAAHLLELLQGKHEVVRLHALDGQRPSRQGTCHEEGAGLDAVAAGAMPAGRVQLAHAGDGDVGRTGAGHLGAHLVEEIGEVDDLGLAGGVAYARLALGGNGGHHQVFRRAHAGKLQQHLGTVQAVGRGGLDEAVVDVELDA